MSVRAPLSPPDLSIVIVNHNYADHLPDAIESALAQSGVHVEVIVVDDGSTDHSAEVLARYADRVMVFTKPRGGQTSGLNLGFSHTRGEAVVFLDADDTLAPGAGAAILGALRGEPAVTLFHWPLVVTDAVGRPTGRLAPSRPLAHGAHRDVVLARGPEAVQFAPASGLAFRTAFLRRVMPLAEEEGRLGYGSAGADHLLGLLAALEGEVRASPRPLGTYRHHGRNDYAARDVREQQRRYRAYFDLRVRRLHAWCEAAGVQANEVAWRAGMWLERFDRSVEDLRRVVPEGAALLVVDDARLHPHEMEELSRRFDVRRMDDGGPEVKPLGSSPLFVAAFEMAARTWPSVRAHLATRLGPGAAVLTNDRLDVWVFPVGAPIAVDHQLKESAPSFDRE